MWKAREFSMGLAVASLAAMVGVLAPQQGWASGGGGGDGGIGSRIELRYSDDEDEIETLEATPERSAYSPPTNFEFALHPRYAKFNGWTLHANITDGKEENTEEPTVFTTNYSAPALNFQLGMRMRFRWRFPESDDNEPTSTTAIKDNFSTWVNNETLEAVDEEEESGTTDSPGLSLSETGFLQSLKLNVGVQLRISDWMGSDTYKKFQAQYGSISGNAGAEDLSEWDGNMRYCGGACVGNYY